MFARPFAAGDRMSGCAKTGRKRETDRFFSLEEEAEAEEEDGRADMMIVVGREKAVASATMAG